MGTRGKLTSFEGVLKAAQEFTNEILPDVFSGPWPPPALSLSTRHKLCSKSFMQTPIWGPELC